MKMYRILRTVSLKTNPHKLYYGTKAQEFKPLQRYQPHDLRKGTGGRNSFNGVVATVFGCTGFVGRYVANRLGRFGTQMILPFRGDEHDIIRLRVAGDPGQVILQHFYLKDEESIKKCVKYSNCVINLIGRDWETKSFKFCDVHVEGAARLAKIAKSAGVETFVHVSTLNASMFPEPFLLRNGSQWLSTKLQGEEAVKEEFPDATIIRPSDIYGQEDRFVRYYCSNWRHGLPLHKGMPLYKSGEKTEKQPIHVSDVAKAIVEACMNKSWRGKTIQAVGPCRYKLCDLIDWFHLLTRKDKEWGYFRYNMAFDPFFKLKVSLLPRCTLGDPLGNLHWERVERECISDKIETDLDTLQSLGMELVRMEDQVPWETRLYRIHMYTEREDLEYSIIEPPTPVSSSSADK